MTDIEPAIAVMLQNALSTHRAGRLDEAERLYRRALEARPDIAEAWHLLGALLHQAGKGAEAVGCLERAVALDPGHLKARGNLGVVLLGLGRLDEAVDVLRALVTDWPDHAKGHFDLANALTETGAAAEAADAYRRAVELEPGFAEAHANLGLLLSQLGHPAKAVDSLRAAAEAGKVGAWVDLGNVLSELGRDDEAEAAYRHALKAEPGNADAHYNLGNLLNRSLRLEEAERSYRKALEARPGDSDALAQLFHLLQRTCAWGELAALDAELDQATDAALSAGTRPGETPFMSLTRHMEPERNLRIAAAWSDDAERRFAAVRDRLEFRHRPVQRDRIRLGYVSGNFFDHATAHNTGGLFGLHDRERFSVFTYSYGLDDGSVFRRRIEQDSDRFTDVADLSPGEAARKIHADEVDILIGLMGHTTGSRIEIAALRPAPVQVSYLTFPGSSGAGFFDYVLLDRAVVPEDELRFYREAPVYLPGTYWPTDNRLAIAEPGPDRAEAGLPDGGFVFSSFNHAQKIEPVMFGIWMEILKAVEGSVLWLLRSNDVATGALRRQAEARGVDPGRLIFADYADKDVHLARLRLADLVLDTRIYNGHTTNTDALWAGVPVITLPGGHFASRVSASVLRAMDLGHLIVEDLGAYRTLAIDLARDSARLAALRAEVAAKRDVTPLFDTASKVRDLEAAFTIMWEQWIAGRAPARIDIDHA